MVLQICPHSDGQRREELLQFLQSWLTTYKIKWHYRAVAGDSNSSSATIDN